MINLSLPLGGYVSFSQVSVNLLRQFYKKDIKSCLFPIGGNVNLEAFKIDEGLKNYIQQSIARAPSKYKKTDPTFRLWHINQSWDQIGCNQFLYSFLETDTLTPNEENILQQQSKVFVSSKYTKKVLEDYGVASIHCPLGFDDTEYFETGAQYIDDCISFGLSGKLEHRKATLKVLQLWAAKFGNNRKYRLNVLTHNPFLKNEDQMGAIHNALGGKPYFNIVFLGPQPTNAHVNDFYNACDIHIGMSGGEGWDLNIFNSLCLGKSIIGLNAHAYTEYLNKNNSILIEPSGKHPSHDGVFFQNGSPYNQGNFWSFEDSALIEAFDKSIDSIEIKDGKRISKFYNEAIKTRDVFTYERMANTILENLV